MKKLLFLGIFSLLMVKNLAAQDKTNQLALVLGPNAYSQLPGHKLGTSSHDPGLGYTVGADFRRYFSAHWHWSVGLRYNLWNSTVKSGPLMYESEYSTGVYVYDPTLQHYFTRKYADKSWQLLAGAGWHSRPGKWQWNIDAELGATLFPKSTTGSEAVTRLTAGFGFGPEWGINRHFHVFLQPGGRYVFAENHGYRFLALQAETGVRYTF